MAEGMQVLTIDFNEVRAIMKEMEDLRQNTIEASLRRVQEIMKRLGDQSEGGTADQLTEAANRMLDAFLKLMDAVADFIKIVLDAVFKNEQTDKDSASKLKTTAQKTLYNN